MKTETVPYEIIAEQVEQHQIRIQNPNQRPILYRVDINHQLVKLLYIEPHSTKSVICQEKIKDLQIKELK